MTHSFVSGIRSFAPQYDLKIVFNDFLTMILCTVSRDPTTLEPCDQDIYQRAFERYRHDHKRAVLFPQLFTCLMDEVEERLVRKENPDILGEFYDSQQGYPRKRFRDWRECRALGHTMMSLAPPQSTALVVDHNCASGRLLLGGVVAAGDRSIHCFGSTHHQTFMKMAALNLLMCRVPLGEVMWGDAERRSDFRYSYQLSSKPFGVLRIKDKNHSAVWHMRQADK